MQPENFKIMLMKHLATLIMFKNIFLLAILSLVMSTMMLDAKEKGLNPHYVKGYLGNVALGGTVGLDYDFGSRTTLLTSHGYSFGNGAFVGLGTGVMMDFAGHCTIPLFTNFKYSFINNTVSPFIDYKMGGSIYDLSSVNLFVSPSVGVDVGRFSFSIGYILQASRDIYTVLYDYAGDSWTQTSITPVTHHWLNFTVAVSF